MSDFLDFSAAERALWWDVLKQPFDKWATVLRWAVSTLSYGVVQDMQPSLVESIAGLRDDYIARQLVDAPLAVDDGEEEPENYSYEATLQGMADSLAKDGYLTDDRQVLVDILPNPAYANAVVWIWEVAETEEFGSVLDLRREVCNQLQAEIEAAGDCGVVALFHGLGG